LTRSPALIGALLVISIFIRAEAAARFDGFFACTAKPYVPPLLRIPVQHRMFADH
jgi:hypothetical protein